MIKRILITSLILILLLLFAVVGGILYSYKVMNNGQMVAKDITYELPFDKTNSGHIKIWVTINGTQYPFILDTGASNILFINDNYDLADFGDLTLKWFGILKGSKGNWMTNKIYRLSSFDLSGVKFEGMSFKVIKHTPSFCSQEIRGIIGKETMKHLVWNFRPKENRIIVSKDGFGFPPVGEADSIKLKKNKFSDHLRVSLSINGTINKDFLVDTGYNSELTFGIKKRDSIKQEKLKRINGSASQGLGAIDSTDNYLYFVESLSRGIKVEKNFIAELNTNNFNALGLGILNRFNYIIDFTNTRLILERLKCEPFSTDSFGFGLELDENDNVIVKYTIAGSDAEKKGVLSGTKVERVNNTIVNSSNFCNLKISGDTVNLVIGGSSKVISIYKKSIFEFSSL